MFRRNIFKYLLMMCLFASSYHIYAIGAGGDRSEALLNEQIQNVVDRDRNQYQLPGISISVKLSQDFVKNYVGGFYSLSSNKAITSDTLFQIGSITKTFTAAIIMQLVENHLVNLNDRLTKWLPQYSRWQKITVQNLLNHTSGIYNYTHGKSFDKKLRMNPNHLWSLRELADMAYSHGDSFSPGEKYGYTNTDYILLGMIIERATDKTLQQVFAQFLNQYQLHNTFYSPFEYSKEVRVRMAHGYNRDGTFAYNEDVTRVGLSFVQSAGALIATPDDIINFLEKLFDGQIVASKSLQTMMSIIDESDATSIDWSKLELHKYNSSSQPFFEVGSGMGMGLVYFKHYGFAWVHAGGTAGYESFYAYNPCNGIVVVIMYNVKPKKQMIFTQIADDVFNVLDRSALVPIYTKKFRNTHTLPSFCAS